MYIVVRTEELYWSNCLWWRWFLAGAAWTRWRCTSTIGATWLSRCRSWSIWTISLGPAMATNTQEWINLYLASDWRDWILEEKAYKGHSEGVTGVAGAVQAVLIYHPQHGHHHRPHNVQIFPLSPVETQIWILVPFSVLLVWRYYCREL